jgi:cell division septum initiation protein DivIVA
VRKGFDPTDVRVFLDSVAEQLQILYDREDDLRGRLARAEEQAAHPEMDEATLTAALGQETTRVLRSAHDAAGDMKARAEEGSSQVIHLAHEEAARIRAEGERAAADRASEAEVTAARIRSGAAAEADSVIEAGRQEAQAMLAGVQEDCRGMVREAQEVRARVLADLVRRRRALYGQVEQLRGGRHDLVEALREARLSFDHILETLQRDFDPGGVAQPPEDDGLAEMERAVVAPMREPPRPRSGDAIDPGRGAPDRAAASAERPRPGPPPTTTAAVSAQPPRRQVPASATSTPPPRQQQSAPSAAATPDQPAATPVRGDAPSVTPGEEAAAAADPGEAGPSTSGGEQATDRRRSGFRIIRRPRHAPPDETRERDASPEESTTPKAPEDDEGIRILASAPGTAMPADAPSGERDGADGGGPGVGATEQPQPTPATRPRGRSGGRHRAPGSSAVDELFAKIKAGRSPSAGRGRQQVAEPEADEQPEPEPDEQPRAEEKAEPERPPQAEEKAEPERQPKAEESPQPEQQPKPERQLEAEETPQPERQAEKGDKGEEQTEATEESADDRESTVEVSFLRRRDDAVGPITVALSRKLKRALQDDQNDLLDRLRSRGTRQLLELLPPVADHEEHFRRAGVDLLDRAERAGTSFLREGRESEGRTNGSAGGEKGSVVLAGEMARAITDPLRRRLERSLGEGADPEDASLVDNVGAAYREWKGPRIERVAGDHVVAAFSRGELGVAREGTALRWIVDDGDERCPDCDDNALAGPLPRGERYPTGQAHPPAHSGCRCLLAPPPA